MTLSLQTERSSSGANRRSAAPLALCDMLEEAERRLDEAPLALPLEFRISWQGLMLDARMAVASDGRALLTIKTCLGRLPYSAEGHQTRARAVATILSHRLKGRDPVVVGAMNHVLMTSRTELPQPGSLLELVQSLTLVMLALDADIGTLREDLLPVQ